ncbi:MAG TPA: hypothetical protein VEA18_00010 [Candidatus Kapabacteria bacterium]|nr:hypothetical protein [Candidatus Kapabacteria bacterium]
MRSILVFLPFTQEIVMEKTLQCGVHTRPTGGCICGDGHNAQHLLREEMERAFLVIQHGPDDGSGIEVTFEV